ncbi:DMT family transporter [Pinisolibacter aquiterrae]|uniref:DMT family transporter n=1 Tax=Pinisolibacter aquiterrae TaxID=2815579 RepID=UPI001C3C25B9|nr:DMT family transporter [Pinisolibacter aquiterrae]MBV5263920.1 DMT family transporter [Pinisolibacter aquiterrae]MCC8235931.1 DMT family transporter [Pinisolibacter aquiterrae]
MSRLTVFLATVVTMIAFAGNALIGRAALRDTAIDAMSYTSIRLAAGAVVLVVIARLVRRGRERGSARLGGTWTSALALFAYAILFSFAYRGMAAGSGALVLFAAVQATMIGWGLVQGERFRPIQIAGLAIAGAGLVWLVAPGLDAPPLGAASAMAASGVAWGVYSLRGRGAGDPLAASAGNFARALPFAGLGSLVAATSATLDPAGVALAIASGAITSGIGYAIWYTVVPRLAATTAATVQLTVPAIASGMAVVFLGEALTLRLVLASIAILGGIAVVIVWRRKPPAIATPR